jgi:hypothetical protein
LPCGDAAEESGAVGFWFTSATLAARSDGSTGSAPLFAHSGQRTP